MFLPLPRERLREAGAEVEAVVSVVDTAARLRERVTRVVVVVVVVTT